MLLSNGLPCRKNSSPKGSFAAFDSLPDTTKKILCKKYNEDATIKPPEPPFDYGPPLKILAFPREIIGEIRRYQTVKDFAALSMTCRAFVKPLIACSDLLELYYLTLEAKAKEKNLSLLHDLLAAHPELDPSIPRRIKHSCMTLSSTCYTPIQYATTQG